MAQGQAISLFSRMYAQTKDEKWIKACDLVLKPLTVNVEEEGLQTELFS